MVAFHSCHHVKEGKESQQLYHRLKMWHHWMKNLFVSRRKLLVVRNGLILDSCDAGCIAFLVSNWEEIREMFLFWAWAAGEAAVKGSSDLEGDFVILERTLLHLEQFLVIYSSLYFHHYQPRHIFSLIHTFISPQLRVLWIWDPISTPPVSPFPYSGKAC